MGDPRGTRDFSPKRFDANAAQTERKYLAGRQPGVTGEHDARQTLNENVRRLRDQETVAPEPKKIFAAKPGPLPGDPFPPPPAQHRDWHKKGSLRVTVSNQHIAGQDTDLDPDAYHTITDGYTAAKDLYSTYILVFPSQAGIARVEMEVRGYFHEKCVFDSPNVDVVGVGWPTITYSLPADPGTEMTIVTITKDCTKIIFDGFRIITPTIEEGFYWKNALGLNVAEGNESGAAWSDTQLYNLIIGGSGTQMYLERRVYMNNVKAHSTDNYSNPNATEASVIFRYCFGTVDVMGDIYPQRGWSIAKNCHFSGENYSWLKRGKAVSAYAYKSDFSTWVPNAHTMGADATHSRTGVFFETCQINGWTENLGWVWQYDHCTNVQGRWINDDGAGGAHHIMTVKSGTPDINAYTYFKGGTQTSVNYLVNMQDVNAVPNPGTASANIWLWHSNHNTPTDHTVAGGIAGSCVTFNQYGAGFNANPTANVYGVHASTHAKFYWFLALAEGAINLVNCTKNAVAQGVAQRVAYTDLYSNIIP